MTYTIRTEDNNNNQIGRIILWVIFISLIVILIYFLIRYVIIPMAKGEILSSFTNTCTARPDIPSGLTANANGIRANVKWTETKGATFYTLYLSRVNNFAPGAAERTIKVYGNSVTVLNLSPSTYYFKLSATNNCGTSATSPQVILPITTFPNTFKLCKRNNPTFCLNIEGVQDSAVFISGLCPNNNCILDYTNDNKIGKVDNSYCLMETNIAPVESGVISKTCSETMSWNIDIPTGRVTTMSNLCLGADNTEGLQAYDTDCTLISNINDARYQWDIQSLS